MENFATVTSSYIDGEWVSGKSNRVYKNVNPFDNSLITELTIATKAQVQAAFEAAEKAQKSWGLSKPEERTKVIEGVLEYLKQHKDEIVEMSVKETGGSFLKGNVEHHLGLEVVEEALRYADKLNEVVEVPGGPEGKVNRIYRKPVGVVTSISPFNFPFNLALRSIIPAIALGNTVVHKPDIQVGIISGAIIAKAFEAAGLPSGVFNMVQTDIEEIGDDILENPISSLITFTGSTAVGRHIGAIAGRNLKGVALELGGNNPFVVLSDADVEQAVNAAIFGKYMHQGQICMCINRMIIHKDLYEAFIEKFAKRAKQVPYGDTSDPSTIIGPLINQGQIKKYENFIAEAKASGARVILEGERVGNVFSPSIFADVDNQSDLAKHEIFGPAVMVIKADSDEEAMMMAGDTAHGLSSAVFTNDLAKGEELALALDTGMTHVNDQPVNDAPNIPFGGTKASGLGRFGNPWMIDKYTKTKWISVQTKDRQYPF